MKKTIVFIVILLLLIAACMYYNCMQKDKCEQEKQAAVAAAVENAIDSLHQRDVLEAPKQQVIAHKPPPPEPVVVQQVEPELVVDNMFVDERDGQQYKMIDANGQWWMAQNLNFESEDSWCYDLAIANCDEFGRIYTWNSAMDACPDGWHLPDDTEWFALIDYYGGKHYAGKNLKEGGPSGFNVLMAGYRDKAGFFGKVGESAYFWSSTEENREYASFKGMYHKVDNVGTYTYTKADGLSVRCIKD